MLPCQREATVAEFLQCPQCRGYNLERQWCDLCKGAGMVRNEERCAPTAADIRTFADVIRDAAMKRSGEQKA